MKYGGWRPGATFRSVGLIWPLFKAHWARHIDGSASIQNQSNTIRQPFSTALDILTQLLAKGYLHLSLQCGWLPDPPTSTRAHSRRFPQKSPIHLRSEEHTS